MHSFDLAKQYLGKEVTVTIDRPLGSHHPTYNFTYPVNYGFVADTHAPDGEELDAYVLGVSESLTELTGSCIAIIHRQNDDDDKLVVVPPGTTMTDDEILTAVHFQEQWFTSEVVRQ